MPVIIKPDVDARPYTLVEYDRNWFLVRTRRFATLAELAAAAYANSFRLAENSRWPCEWLTGKPVRQLAYNLRGKLLAVDELATWGSKLRFSSWRPAFPQQNPVWRQDPVRGTGKRRGGSARRRWRTQQERRDNAFVLKDEGEVAARPTRCGGYLPNSWDWSPYAKGLRGWKGQHKGRKSWDRPARHGAKP